MNRFGTIFPIRRIRWKLSLLMAGLVLLVSGAAYFIMSRQTEEMLLRELLRRGEAVSLSVATPAGFSILAGDRLALDNLAAKVQGSQADVAYLAIVDRRLRIVAHSAIGEVGEEFRPAAGELLSRQGERTVHTVRRDEGSLFEFRTPIDFSGKHVGDVYLGIDDASLRAARNEARQKLLFAAAAAILPGLAGAALLGRVITRPIQRLSVGVQQMKAGRYHGEVAVTSRDELGTLTADFNAMAREIVQQKNGLARSARELEDAYVSMVRILAAAIDARDEYTLGHSTRVASLALRLGRRLRLVEADLRELAIACFLHDVGKIRIPDHILNKRGNLDAAERARIVRHPEDGAEILRLSESLQRYVPAVLHHHEWYDGSGYPAGLQGDEIPLFAALVAIADAYDAMTSSRPYRPGLSRSEAAAELRRCSGTQFAPALVAEFIAILEDEGQLWPGEEGVPEFIAMRSAR